MKVSEIGEFGLIRELTELIEQIKNPDLRPWKKLLISSGDDTAAWKSDAPVILATTDCLIQDIHFNLKISTWEELGWKSIAINLSDIAAMGGIPDYALVSLALPGEIELDSVKNLYRGMMEAANQFEIAIVGGNVSSSNVVAINIMLTGTLRSQNALTRSAALVGDKIAVTGFTGLSAAGLKMLKCDLHFDSEVTNIFRQAHLKPVPRVGEGQTLLRCGVKAGIDISDGLIADLSHICESSNIGAKIILSSLPIHPFLKAGFKDDYLQMSLTGGEDYELLFTAPDNIVQKVRKVLTCPMTVIGEIVDDPMHKVALIGNQGEPVSFQNQGWEHFKSVA